MTLLLARKALIRATTAVSSLSAQHWPPMQRCPPGQQTLPQARSGLFVAFFFSFVTSFDNFTATAFLASKGATLPVEIFFYIDSQLDPTVSAVATLLMAGDGPLRDELDQRARSLGVRAGTPACRLLGPVSDSQRFLAAIDVLLLPSATEGIPGVLVEAALVGVPTVATDVGGVRDALTTMSAGRCVPVDDFDGFVAAVRAVAADPGRDRPDRDAALKHHAIEAVADRWEQVLLEVGR